MYPLDVVKTRMQLQVSGAAGEGYKNMIDCFAKIIKNEGYDLADITFYALLATPFYWHCFFCFFF